MKKFALYFFILILFSCNKEKESDSKFRNDFGMYTILINEVDFHSFYLEEQIENEISKLRNSNKLDNEILKVDSITKIYTSFIDENISELSKGLYDENYNIVLDNQDSLISYTKVNNYFFNDTSLSENSILFKKMSNDYSNEILKYFTKMIYAKRISGALTTDIFEDRYGNQIEYFNYIYKDTPLIAVLVHLKGLKRNALEYEQQFLLKKSCLNSDIKIK